MRNQEDSLERENTYLKIVRGIDYYLDIGFAVGTGITLNMILSRNFESIPFIPAYLTGIFGLSRFSSHYLKNNLKKRIDS